MSIASSFCADAVNRTGEKAIEEMEKLKIKKRDVYTKLKRSTRNRAIDLCIEIVRKNFTEWTE